MFCQIKMYFDNRQYYTLILGFSPHPSKLTAYKTILLFPPLSFNPAKGAVAQENILKILVVDYSKNILKIAKISV